MAQAEQDQLTRQVGRALLTVAGADWQQVRAEYRSAGRHIEVDVIVKGPDGVERPMRPPQEVVDGLGRLRQGMYRPGRGTWLSALYVLDPPSAFSAEFEPDVEPRWRRVPPPIGFADELRFFPRGDEHIPDWLRQRAGLPPAPGAQEAGQGDAPQPPPSGQAGGQPGPGGQPAPTEQPAPSGQQAPSGQPMPGGQPAPNWHPGPGQPTPGGQPVPSGQPAPGGQPVPSWQPVPGGQPAPGGQPMPFGGPQTPPPGTRLPQGAPAPFGGPAQAYPPPGHPQADATPHYPAGDTPRSGFTAPQAAPQTPPGIPAGPYVPDEER